MRRRLLVLVISAVAGAVAALVVGFNLLLANTLDSNARDVLHSRAAAQTALIVDKGRIHVGEAPESASADAWVWVLSRGRVLERPPHAKGVDQAAVSLARGPGGYRDVPSADIRLYAVPVVLHGSRAGSVVVALSLAPYEETRTLALVSSLVFGGLVLVARRLCRALAADVVAASGHADDETGRSVERARARSPLRTGGAARRADRARVNARRASRPARGEPAPGATLLR